MREGYPLPREEASVCVFVIGTRAQDLETLEALIRVYTSLRLARLMHSSAAVWIRLWIRWTDGRSRDEQLHSIKVV